MSKKDEKIDPTGMVLLATPHLPFSENESDISELQFGEELAEQYETRVKEGIIAQTIQHVSILAFKHVISPFWIKHGNGKLTPFQKKKMKNVVDAYGFQRFAVEEELRKLCE
ncbi:hypothetical protein ADUPG1_008802 [Aduncisulcus paluster]|uniref:Uncharacterized protein n=1 Tax=Aduncisulcus paluster TaxID=2918883 RepID=A0ABQ5KTB2_9EUKA|nr:hypothetical protein ADUPG1_008802 [Aduncisulcus paluster]|eukprot:gnl/Carplike_NY0171/3599_a4863_406.p1 GENE.gnl/Carplike_NY0171/3599_a4863_406~~gnl/Carplike_NY0171/3599_a4863_406.p1  ORF type:complete len:112 (+),score=21.44 gnl/Carplike_NY0171/3599_a4863_406:156-491(+)